LRGSLERIRSEISAHSSLVQTYPALGVDGFPDISKPLLFVMVSGVNQNSLLLFQASR
jgi:hypothetical protein